MLWVCVWRASLSVYPLEARWREYRGAPAGMACVGSAFLQQLADAWQQQLPWIIWLGKLLPLLIFLPGMLRDNLRSYIWLCFVSLMYFVALVERLFALPGNLPAVAGMVAVVTLFVSAMMYVRWRARELRGVTAAQTESGD